MKAMIMAAGYGSRMGALTDNTPKPLLKVDEWRLIEHILFRLANAGINDVVINVSYLADVFMAILGNGQRYGVTIHYSHEPEPLHWGGGILNALPLLGDDPFLAISGDLSTDYPFEELCQPSNSVAHLVLTDKGRGHPDFNLTEQGIVAPTPPQYTYGGIGRFDPALFQGYAQGKHGFLEILMPTIKCGKVTGELYCGRWVNVNTPQCLSTLQQPSSEIFTGEGAQACDIGLESQS